VCLAGHTHSEPAAREKIYSLRCGPGFEQHAAGREREVNGTGGERFQRREGHVLEIGAALEAVDRTAQLLPRVR
jgi:hypothetical protein